MPAFDFHGRVVLISGVGRPGQSGETIAAAFGRAGARVLLIDRNRGAARERADDLRAGGFDAHPFDCDLTDREAVQALAPRVADLAPNGLHGLVSLAGGFNASGPVADSDPDVWHRQFAINATTAYLTTRTFLPSLRAAKGSIVYFASAAALPGAAVANLSAYTAAKAAVLALMRAVAAEERMHGVRANAIAPTAIRTAANLATMGEKTAYVERETVAQWVLYLTDGSSGPVTGQVVRLG